MARRPLSLRLKVGLAGLLAVGAALAIPKGGEPPPEPIPSASDQPGITAVEISLDRIVQGVSFRQEGTVRIFLVRTGDLVAAFLGESTAAGNGPVWWCPSNAAFEDESGKALYSRDGVSFGASRNLDRIRVLVSAGRVTIFPASVTPGAAPPPPLPRTGILLKPCSASERLG